MAHRALFRAEWPPTRPGFQRHHLIPLSVRNSPQFSAFFDGLLVHGFSLNDFCSNGQYLPATPALALRSGWALHRGPHRRYSEVVRARIETIRIEHIRMRRDGQRMAADVTIFRLRLVQSAMRIALTRKRVPGLVLHQRDPMHLFDRYDFLDAMIAEAMRAPAPEAPATPPDIPPQADPHGRSRFRSR